MYSKWFIETLFGDTSVIVFSAESYDKNFDQIFLTWAVNPLFLNLTQQAPFAESLDKKINLRGLN
jgi:hypothetical protein